MLTFPVAVQINGKVECIPYIEEDEIFKMNMLYCGKDAYSGYEIYADRGSGKLYAAGRTW